MRSVDPDGAMKMLPVTPTLRPSSADSRSFDNMLVSNCVDVVQKTLIVESRCAEHVDLSVSFASSSKTRITPPCDEAPNVAEDVAVASGEAVAAEDWACERSMPGPT